MHSGNGFASRSRRFVTHHHNTYMRILVRIFAKNVRISQKSHKQFVALMRILI